MHILHLKALSKTGIVCRKRCRAWRQPGLRDGFCMAGLALCVKSWLACRRNTWRVSVQKASVKGLGSLDFFWRWKKPSTDFMLQMKLIACSNLEIIAAYDNLEAEMSTKVFICRICSCAVLCVWLLFLESYELYITCHSMSWPYLHCCGCLSLICKHCLVIFYWFDRFCCLTFFFLILIKYFK